MNKTAETRPKLPSRPATAVGRAERITNHVELFTRILKNAKANTPNTYSIAFMGPFSSGKSTLINHLIRYQLLPAQLEPTQCPPIRISYGNSGTVTVKGEPKHFQSVNTLKKYLLNIDASHVETIDVSFPLPLLRHGIQIYDVTGLFSPEPSHQKMTEHFLNSVAEDIDLPIFLFPASPLTRDNLESIQGLIARKKTPIVAMSRVDLLEDEQIQSLNEENTILLQEIGLESPPLLFTLDTASWQYYIYPDITKLDWLFDSINRELAKQRRLLDFNSLVHGPFHDWHENETKLVGEPLSDDTTRRDWDQASEQLKQNFNDLKSDLEQRSETIEIDLPSVLEIFRSHAVSLKWLNSLDDLVRSWSNINFRRGICLNVAFDSRVANLVEILELGVFATIIDAYERAAERSKHQLHDIGIDCTADHFSTDDSHHSLLYEHVSEALLGLPPLPAPPGRRRLHNLPVVRRLVWHRSLKRSLTWLFQARNQLPILLTESVLPVGERLLLASIEKTRSNWFREMRFSLIQKVDRAHASAGEAESTLVAAIELESINESKRSRKELLRSTLQFMEKVRTQWAIQTNELSGNFEPVAAPILSKKERAQIIAQYPSRNRTSQPRQVSEPSNVDTKSIQAQPQETKSKNWEEFQRIRADLEKLIHQALESSVQDKIDQHFQDRLTELQTRLQNTEFSIAVVGEIKRGKSTVLNALMGFEREVLPTDVNPETARLIKIRFSHIPGAIVHFSNAAPASIHLDELRTYVSAQASKKDLEKTLYAEVGWTSPLLQDGIELVDTPGLNDPNLEREQITLDHLGKAQAVVYLINNFGGPTQGDIDILRQRILYQNGIRGILFVMNKFDEIANHPEEAVQRMLARSEQHIRSAIESLSIGKMDSDIRILPIAARRVRHSGNNPNGDSIYYDLFNEFRQALLATLIDRRGRIVLESTHDMLVGDIIRPILKQYLARKNILETDGAEKKRMIQEYENRLKQLAVEIEVLDKGRARTLTDVEQQIRGHAELLRNDIHSDLVLGSDAITREGGTYRLTYNFVKHFNGRLTALRANLASFATDTIEKSVQDFRNQLDKISNKALGHGEKNTPSRSNFVLESSLPSISANKFEAYVPSRGRIEEIMHFIRSIFLGDSDESKARQKIQSKMNDDVNELLSNLSRAASEEARIYFKTVTDDHVENANKRATIFLAEILDLNKSGSNDADELTKIAKQINQFEGILDQSNNLRERITRL